MSKSYPFKSFGFFIIGGLLVVASIALNLYAKQSEDKGPVPEIHGVVLPSARPIEPFSLKRADAKPFTEKTLQGKWHFLFFGYTYCPDICPTTLSNMRQVYAHLEKKGIAKDVDFVFVSVDPERDDLKRLKQYVTYFNPNFQGITGSKGQLKQLATQLGVPYVVQAKNQKGNYLVDHGSMVVLTNPYGEYQAVFTAPHEPLVMANEFASLDTYFDYKIS